MIELHDELSRLPAPGTEGRLSFRDALSDVVNQSPVSDSGSLAVTLANPSELGMPYSSMMPGAAYAATQLYMSRWKPEARLSSLTMKPVLGMMAASVALKRVAVTSSPELHTMLEGLDNDLFTNTIKSVLTLYVSTTPDLTKVNAERNMAELARIFPGFDISPSLNHPTPLQLQQKDFLTGVGVVGLTLAEISLNE